MSEIKSTRQLWIEKGYEQFALYGPENFSVKLLSKSIGFSRASFYHHFGDIDVFLDELLSKHWIMAKEFNTIGKEKCLQLFPDLYQLLEQIPIPLQFNMQLFHHRDHPRFNFLFVKIYESSARSFALKLFKEQLGLSHREKDVYHLWLTMGEAWYSRLDSNDLTSSTLQKHAEEILNNLSVFVNSPLYATLHKKL